MILIISEKVRNFSNLSNQLNKGLTKGVKDMLKSISLVLLLCLPVVAMAQTDNVIDSSVQKQNLYATIYLNSAHGIL